MEAGAGLAASLSGHLFIAFSVGWVSRGSNGDKDGTGVVNLETDPTGVASSHWCREYVYEGE